MQRERTECKCWESENALTALIWELQFALELLFIFVGFSLANRRGAV